ncbi:MAG: type II secretion system protein [Clostridiales bacterium]|nr:type II secretion system protein [Clostridiales bacterium]
MINKLKNKKGFSLAEVLSVVAIMGILLAVGVGFMFSIQKNSRQKQLDAKAETIYVAVQNKLTSLYAGGLGSVYDPASYSDNSMKCSNIIPGDYVEALGAKINENSIYYITSESGDAFDKLINDEVLDEEILKGNIVIEIIPYAYSNQTGTANSNLLTAATVYGVFYSEDEINVAQDYLKNGGPANNDYQSDYRKLDYRISNDSRVGYYGGGGVCGANVTASLSPKVVISNGEKLTATVKLKKPAGVIDNLFFTFTITDGPGNSYSFCYDEKTDKYTLNDEKGTVADDGNITLELLGQNYLFTITLDDLSSENTRFTNLYGQESSHEQKLVAGTDITLKVGVECPNDGRVEYGEAQDTNNSLFDKSSSSDTAVISKARHLQNLDEKASPINTIEKAVIAGNISLGDGSEWNNTYRSAYYNNVFAVNIISASKNDEKVNMVNFDSIVNKNIKSLSGDNEGNSCIISGVAMSGNTAALFENVGAESLTISDLIMTGTRAYGVNNAASLVGIVEAGKTLVIDNCQIYLDAATGDYPATGVLNNNSEAVRFIQAGMAGGLVAVNNGRLTITDSAVATIIGNDVSETDNYNISGGLVASNTGILDILQSYTDCYIYGSRAGGLVGDNGGKIEISTCFTAGYIAIPSQKTNEPDYECAGFVPGDVDKIVNSYTVIAPYLSKKNQGMWIEEGKLNDKKKGIFYSTLRSAAEVKNVYYLHESSKVNDANGSESLSGLNNETINSMLAAAGFITFENGSHPYKLMGQNISSYPYPGLTGLEQFGDWQQ